MFKIIDKSELEYPFLRFFSSLGTEAYPGLPGRSKRGGGALHLHFSFLRCDLEIREAWVRIDKGNVRAKIAFPSQILILCSQIFD